MKGILLMAYGSPRNLEEIEQYYTHIRRGRRPSKEELNELVKRYKAIGKSPLYDITVNQAKKLQEKLFKMKSNTKVFYAMKHSEPFIDKVAQQVVNEDIKDLLCIVLAPHYSQESVETYFKIVKENVSRLGKEIRVEFVKHWYEYEKFIYAWVRRIKEVEEKIGPNNWLVFSAHSLPERILTIKDPYVEQLNESCQLIAKKLNRNDWSFSFQSAGKTNDKWLGPDLIEHLEELYKKGKNKIIIAPIGFVSDNLEILYDIDIECKSWAKNIGLTLERCRMLNDDDDFIDCLVDITKNYDFI